MTLLTTIEIDEIETEVLVSFGTIEGIAEIYAITTIDWADVSIEPDKRLYEECEEYAADCKAEKTKNGRFFQL